MRNNADEDILGNWIDGLKCLITRKKIFLTNGLVDLCAWKRCN